MKQVLRRFLKHSHSLLIIGIISLMLLVGATITITYTSSRAVAVNQAENTALALVENIQALQRYISMYGRPAAKDVTGPDRFIPELMSTTYIARHVMELFGIDNHNDYTIKYAAINARNPVNEASQDEVDFINLLNQDPTIHHQSTVVETRGNKFLEVMVRGRRLEGGCLECHISPSNAPWELLEQYGAFRGFNRTPGEVAAAMVIRLPLDSAFAAANRLTFKLTGMLLMAIGILSLGYFTIMRLLIIAPLSRLSRSVNDTIADETLLGTPVPLPVYGPLFELAGDFNALSSKLKQERDSLEGVLEEKTIEVAEKTGKLMENEERLQLAVSGANKGVWDYHLNTGIVYFNMQYADIHGFPTDVLERPIEECMGTVNPEDMPGVSAQLRAHALGVNERFDIQYRITTPSGQQKWIQSVGKIVSYNPDNTPRRIAGTVTDITTQKNIEEQLRIASRQAAEEQEKLSSLLSSLSDGVTLVDKDLTIIYQNEVAEEMFGAHSGIPCYEAYHNEERPCDQCPATFSLMQDKPVSFVRNYFRKDSTIGIIEVTATPYRSATGEVIGGVEIARDVTELVNKEKELTRNIAKYTNIIEKSSDGIVIHDTDDVIIEVNRMFMEYTGYSKDEIIGMNLADIHMEENRQDFTRRRPMFYREGSVQREIVLQTKSGKPFHAEISASVITMPDGERIVVGIIRDIRERKQVEMLKANYMSDLERRVNDEITARRLQEQLLIQQSKMAAMGEMVGAIAHQWRQPLNALGLFIQDVETASLDGRLQTDEFIEELITKSMRQIGYMSETIEDFRAFFRPSKLPTAFDMRRAVSDTLRIVSAQLSRYNIDIEITGLEDTSTLMVHGYKNELKQALLNIVNNAKDAITVGESRSDGGTITVDLSFEEGFVKTAITDSGGGIPEDIISRVFEPYFSTKGDESGTGIGLYMARVIIENNMHGTIMVKNVDGGAQFTIMLPNYDPDVADENAIAHSDTRRT